MDSSNPIHGSRQDRARGSSVGMSNEEVLLLQSDEYPNEASELVGYTLFCLLHLELGLSMLAIWIILILPEKERERERSEST